MRWWMAYIYAHVWCLFYPPNCIAIMGIDYRDKTNERVIVAGHGNWEDGTWKASKTFYDDTQFNAN